jgi:hypothetical protein
MFNLSRAEGAGEVIQTQAVAQNELRDKSGPVAKAAIDAQIKTPSKLSNAWNFTIKNLPRMAYSIAIEASVVLSVLGITLLGAISPVAIAGYAIGGIALLGAGIYEYRKAKAADLGLSEHAKALFNAVRKFDNLPSTSNTYVTARKAFLVAKEEVEKDLVRLNPSDKEAFVREVASAIAPGISRKYRINTSDARYDGIVIEGKEGATFEQFVRAIVDRQIESVKTSYDAELTSYAQTIVAYLRKPALIPTLKHNMNEVAYTIAGKREYRMLGKGLKEVSKDLTDRVRDISDTRYTRSRLEKLNSLGSDRYGFWSGVRDVIENIKSKYRKEYESRRRQIEELEQRFRDLDDALNGLSKEMMSVLDFSKKEEYYKRAKNCRNDLVPKLEAGQEEIKAKKAAVLNDIEKLRKEQATKEVEVGSEQLEIINAERGLLAEFLGIEIKDLNLPAHPTFGDKAKHWAPRVVLGTAAIAGLSAGAYYGWPYVSPYAASALTFVNSKLEDFKDWINPVDKAPYPAFADKAPYPAGSIDQAPFPAIPQLKENTFDSYPSGEEYARFFEQMKMNPVK